MSFTLFCIALSLVLAIEDQNRDFKEEDLELNANGVPTKSINWVTRGCVTPVNNQGQCGADWAFVSAQVVESQNCATSGTLTAASVQDIIDCDPQSNGCNGGSNLNFPFIISQGGLPTAACYPFGGNGVCKKNCPISSNLRLKNFSAVDTNEVALYNALRNGTVWLFVDASTWDLYTGGIFTGCPSPYQWSDHVVQLVGYSSTNGGYWIIRNTWGTGWGNEGYIWIPYGSDACGVASNAVAVSIF